MSTPDTAREQQIADEQEEGWACWRWRLDAAVEAVLAEMDDSNQPWLDAGSGEGDRPCRVFKKLSAEIISHGLPMSMVSCDNWPMKSYRADAARRKMRDILTAVERGEHVQIQRYDTPTAIVVSPGWFKRALISLGEPEPVFEEDGSETS